jgi:ABC-type lipoprotein export system ATPase subunit
LTDTMVHLTDVSKIYKTGPSSMRAVDDVSLKIGSGQMVSIVGHSGSGKTTLLSLIGGLTKPSTGSVVLDGTDIWSISDRDLSLFRNRLIGFSFQFASLIPTLNVYDNVRLPSTFDGARSANKNRAQDLLDLVGLGDRGHSFPSQLSGGEQRRVALARTLMNEPRLILADEPTGDLDEDTESEILEIFKKINAEGVTIVIVTHSRAVASQAQLALKMSKGHLSETAVDS